MTFLQTVLEPPAYGWRDENGELVKPTHKQIITEFFSRLNVFKNKKNWLPFTSWMLIAGLSPFFTLYFIKYLSVTSVLIGFVYGMIIMGSHGTIWHHRYCTHGAYKFRNGFWRFFTQNLTLRIIPEEIYAISHHVHHALSDTPGDPYNAQAGFLYCFLADVNHQPIAKNMTEKDYARCINLMKHTGIRPNTYVRYQKWGSIACPLRTVAAIVLNWAFWFTVWYLIGGPALVCTLFASAGVWAVGVRTFNYEGHGKGKDKRKEGTDYNRDDMSINQFWPGFVAGEWHNNHHLYPKSARSGFKPYQVDFAWYYIKFMSMIGAISSYKDSKKQFYKDYYRPELNEPVVMELIEPKVVVVNE